MALDLLDQRADRCSRSWGRSGVLRDRGERTRQRLDIVAWSRSDSVFSACSGESPSSRTPPLDALDGRLSGRRHRGDKPCSWPSRRASPRRFCAAQDLPGAYHGGLTARLAVQGLASFAVLLLVLCTCRAARPLADQRHRSACSFPATSCPLSSAFTRAGSRDKRGSVLPATLGLAVPGDRADRLRAAHAPPPRWWVIAGISMINGVGTSPVSSPRTAPRS